MYEANFWHIILKMLNYIPEFYTSDFNELAYTLNNRFIIFFNQELDANEKFGNKFYVIKQHARRHEDFKITLLELDILKCILKRIYENSIYLEDYEMLKQNILLLIVSAERMSHFLETCDYKNMFLKKQYLKRSKDMV